MHSFAGWVHRFVRRPVCSGETVTNPFGEHWYCIKPWVWDQLAEAGNGRPRQKGATTERVEAGNLLDRHPLSEAPIRKRQHSVGYENHRSSIVADVPSHSESASRIRSFDHATFESGDPQSEQ
jgi:hypothetical protein